jgi:hypothetical protein
MRGTATTAVCALAVALLATRCSIGSEGTGGPGPDPGPGPVNPTAVTGTILVDWVGNAGIQPKAWTATAGQLEIIVPGSSSAYQLIPFPLGEDGTFSVEGVPAGPYYLRFLTDYFFTSSRNLVLGWEDTGRPDAGWITQATPVTFNISGLASWTVNDNLSFFSRGAGTSFAWLDEAGGAVNAPAVGATSLSGFQVNFALANVAKLMSAGAGDTGLVYQSVGKTSGTGQGYAAMDRVLTTSSLSLTNGQPATISGAFTDLNDASNLSASINWRRSEFERFRTAVHPQAVRDYQILTISAVAPGLRGGNYVNSPNLALLSRLGAGTSDADMATGALSYPPYFPADWTVFCYVKHEHKIPIQAPGAAIADLTVLGLYASDRIASCTSQPLEPVVSPPRNVTVNGNSIAAGLSGVGLRPTIAWTAPEIGAPSGYVVIINRLVASNGATVSERVGRVFLSGTELVLPPGLLQAGQSYFLGISALYREGNGDLSAAPFQGNLPMGEAITWSNRVSP